MENNNNLLADALLKGYIRRDENSLNAPMRFLQNYEDMNNVYNKTGNSADKYFHAKANFQSTQDNDIETALKLDFLKEARDIPLKIYKKYKYKQDTPIMNILLDSLDDLKADFMGLGLGNIYRNGNPQNLLKEIRPNWLDSKY